MNHDDENLTHMATLWIRHITNYHKHENKHKQKHNLSNWIVCRSLLLLHIKINGFLTKWFWCMRNRFGITMRHWTPSCWWIFFLFFYSSSSSWPSTQYTPLSSHSMSVWLNGTRSRRRRRRERNARRRRDRKRNPCNKNNDNVQMHTY